MHKHIPHSLEVLETRIAPASFSASAVAGLLTIGAANPASGVSVEVVQIGDAAFSVDDLNDADPAVEFTDIKGIKIKGTDGNDSIAFRTSSSFAPWLGNLSIDAGLAAPEDFESPGDLVVLGEFDGTVRGNVIVKAIGDNSRVVLNGGTIRGDTKITVGNGIIDVNGGTYGGLNLVGGREVDLDEVNVYGSAIIKGNKTVPYDLDIDDSSFRSSLNVSGTPLFDFISMDYVEVDGTLKITTGDDNDEVELWETGTNGSLVISTGKGDDDVYLDSIYAESASKVSLGDGHNELFLDGDEEEYRSDIYSDLSVTAGTGSDTVFIDRTYIAGNLKVALGNALPQEVISENPEFPEEPEPGRNLFVLGATSGEFESGSVDVDGNVSYAGGIDSDIVEIGQYASLQGIVKIADKNGSNEFSVSNYGAISKLIIAGGKGDDAVELGEFGYGGYGAGFTRVIAKLGEGNDTLSLFSEEYLTLLADGGTHTDGDQLFRYSLDPVSPLIEKILGFESIAIHPILT